MDEMDLRRRVIELEKVVARHERIIKRIPRLVDMLRQAFIIALGAVEDLGNLERTIPPRKDRRKQ